MRFSASVLKIDRSFLEFDSARQGSLVQAVSDLGRTLDLLVVAEGVETVEQVDLARNAGCHAAQGYWFARPADETQTTLLLERDPHPDRCDGAGRRVNPHAPGMRWATDA